MSRAWAKGSSRAWRRVREFVLARDGRRCQLALDGCTTTATEVHHTAGRLVTGDDPKFLVASCSTCNKRTGDPTKADPPHTPGRTSW